MLKSVNEMNDSSAKSSQVAVSPAAAPSYGAPTRVLQTPPPQLPAPRIGHFLQLSEYSVGMQVLQAAPQPCNGRELNGVGWAGVGGGSEHSVVDECWASCGEAVWER